MIMFYASTPYLGYQKTLTLDNCALDVGKTEIS